VVGGGKDDSKSRDESLARQQVGYAHREFEILSELSHPNIMRLLEHWEDRPSRVVVMALSYAKGPTLHWLIVRGGRLSFTFARVVAAQLVDAVSYLHSRAVIHRDLKPDNLVVTGADPAAQHEIWDEERAGADKEKDGDEGNGTPWPELVAKWHVTLVDFGFARALTPSDVKGSSTRATAAGGMDGSSSSGASGGSQRIGGRRRSSAAGLDRSMTKRFTRMMSAVGNRAYAAPEVQRGIVDLPLDESVDLGRSGASTNSSVDPNSSSLASSASKSRRGMFRQQRSSSSAFDVTKTLSAHVSTYGLNADAYSVGGTMLHMLTGARPDQNVNELVAIDNSPVVVLCRLLCGSCSKGTEGGSNGHRTVKYRRVGDIAPEPLRLIRGLMHPDPDQRTTVRTARLYPYVDDVLAETGRHEQNQTFKTIDYLQCALRRGGKGGGASNDAATAPSVAPASPPADTASVPEHPNE
jgi:serine/threonine protein kinase